MRTESEKLGSRSRGPIPQGSLGQSTLLEASRYLDQVSNGQSSTDLLDKALLSAVAEQEGFSSPGSHVWNNTITSSGDGDLPDPLSSSAVSIVHNFDGSLPLHEPISDELYILRSPGAFEIDPILDSPKAFLPKQIGNLQSWLNRAYVITSLRSYPEMLLSGQTLPPFIHPCCLVNTVQDPQPVGFDTRPALPGHLRSA